VTTVLAFDFGASSGRAVLGSFDGDRISYNIPVQDGNRLAWDFFAIVDEIKRTVDRYPDVDALAFDTWGVDYGLIGRQDTLVSLPTNYRDARTNGVPEVLFQSVSPEKLYKATGNQIMAINTLFQLLTEENERLDADTMLFMPDLFAWSLCGSRSVERTIASTSQMVDPATGDWNREITALTRFNDDFFPEIVGSATICGTYKGIPVIKVAGHDTQCAVAAMPCNSESEAAFLSCGTWSLIGCELDAPILTQKSMADELSNEIGANGKINYLKNISGLWLIQEIRRNFRRQGKEYSYNDMEQEGTCLHLLYRPRCAGICNLRRYMRQNS